MTDVGCMAWGDEHLPSSDIRPHYSITHYRCQLSIVDLLYRKPMLRIPVNISSLERRLSWVKWAFRSAI